jgi:hypothetical protein
MAMAEIIELAPYLRRGAAVIQALLDHINGGQPISEEMMAAAREAAQDLIALSENLAPTARGGSGDPPKRQH